MATKAYIHYEGDKLVTSKRNHRPPRMVAECPKDKDGNYVVDLDCIDVYNCPETGVVKADAIQHKIDQKRHEAEEQRKKERERKESVKKAKKEVSFSNISQEDLAKAKSFDDIKKFISYLLKINGVD